MSGRIVGAVTSLSSAPTQRLDGKPSTADILAQIRDALDSESGVRGESMAREYAPHERFQTIESIRVLSGVQFGDTYAVTARIVYQCTRSSVAIVAELRTGYRPARHSSVPSGLDSIPWLVHHPFDDGTLFEVDAKFKFAKTPSGWVLQ